jgi:hypothetical protein
MIEQDVFETEYLRLKSEYLKKCKGILVSKFDVNVDEIVVISSGCSSCILSERELKKIFLFSTDVRNKILVKVYDKNSTFIV